jgi:hypothetical protein
MSGIFYERFMATGVFPLYVAPWARDHMFKSRGPSEPSRLQYLRNADSELGEAIRFMAWRSAWAKWFASEQLANNDHKTTDEAHVMQIAASKVWYNLKHGQLELWGRRSRNLDYEPVPQSHWRSTSLHMIRDRLSLWHMVLVPNSVSEILPDGTVRGHDAAPTQRTAQQEEYDSLIVNSRQFEALWPLRDKKADKERKRLLKIAKEAGADRAEIAKLWRD